MQHDTVYNGFSFVGDESLANELVQVLHDLHWPALSAMAANSLEGVLKEAHQYGIPVLFRESRQPNPDLPEHPYWVLRESVSPIPQHLYENERIMKAYVKFIKDIVAVFRGILPAHSQLPPELTDKVIREAIIDFDTKLAKVNMFLRLVLFFNFCS